MIAHKVVAARHGTSFEEWLSYLAFARPGKRNRDRLTEYFFAVFTQAPETLYAFLLHLKQYLESTPPGTAQEHLAIQYLTVLSPLSERFGVYAEKSELDELCFSLTEPAEFERLEQELKQYKKSSEKLTEKALSTIQKLLEDEGYDCIVKGRYKSIYSIYCKLKKRHKLQSPLELHDIFAFRIILQQESKQQCFDVLNLLHDRFQPITKRFKDYITIPKINGYQSIHTCLNQVIPEIDLPIEIQIRTQIMDDFAEKGMASHWLYAREKKTKLLNDVEKRLLLHFATLSSLSRNAIEKMVHFFSFEGDVYVLPRGSTSLDFAYTVHTDVGNRAHAAVINGTSCALGSVIQDGDRVQIVTGDKECVCKEWLTDAFNPSTRKKIYEHAQS